MKETTIVSDLCGCLVNVTCQLTTDEIKRVMPHPNDHGDWRHLGTSGRVRAVFQDNDRQLKVLIDPENKDTMIEVYASNIARQ